MSNLKPEGSIAGGVAVAAVVFAIHSTFTPSMADMQGLPSGNADVDKSERRATYLSAGVVAGISLVAKDPTIFVFGAGAAIAMALITRHSVWTDSASGMVNAAPGQSAVSANDTATGPQMGDTQAYQAYSNPGSEFVSS